MVIEEPLYSCRRSPLSRPALAIRASCLASSALMACPPIVVCPDRKRIVIWLLSRLFPFRVMGGCAGETGWCCFCDAASDFFPILLVFEKNHSSLLCFVSAARSGSVDAYPGEARSSPCSLVSRRAFVHGSCLDVPGRTLGKASLKCKDAVAKKSNRKCVDCW